MSLIDNKTKESNYEFIIYNLTFHTPDGRSIDLNSIYQNLSIYENYNTGHIHLKLALYDIYGFDELIPIIGEEVIEMNVSKKNSPEQYNFIFRVSVVIPPVKISDSTNIFIIEGVTDFFYQNFKHRVVGRYSGNCLDIVSELFNKFNSNTLDSKKLKFISDDKPSNNISHLFTNIRPLDAINIVSKKSLNPESKFPSYMFWEGKNDFYFCSIESLQKLVTYAQYTYSPLVTNTPNSDKFNVLQYALFYNRNIINNAMDGVFNNKIINYDMNNMAFEVENYSLIEKNKNNKFIDYNYSKYKDAYYNYPHINNNRMFTKNLDINNTTLNHFILQHIDKTITNTTNSNNLYRAKSLLLNKLMNSINLTIQVPLDLDISVGRKIHFNIPSLSSSRNFGFESHIFYSGTYIVTDVHHNFTQGIISTTTFKCFKDGLNEDINQSYLNQQDINDVLYETLNVIQNTDISSPDINRPMDNSQINSSNMNVDPYSGRE